MSIHRQAAKRDTNEREIVATLTQVGATVQKLSAKGCPDLLVGFKGQNFLMEIKTTKGKLTPDEAVWHDNWRGHVAIIRSSDEALELLGILEWRTS